MLNTDEKMVLRMPELKKLIGLSRSKIYEMLNPKSDWHDPDFPKQIRLSAGAVGWYRHELLEWLELRRKEPDHDK
ncbi:MAG: helix-turn-helix transcriptional regulator [Pseudomonadota bacterium]